MTTPKATYGDKINRYAQQTNSRIYFFAFHPSRLQASSGGVEQPHAASFKAFVNDFDETFASSWEAQQYYGKTDAFVGFKNTKRTISLSWKIPSINLSDAQIAYRSLNSLALMLYPVYIDGVEVLRNRKDSIANTAIGLINRTKQIKEFYDSLNNSDAMQVSFQPSALPLGKPPLIGVAWGELIKNRNTNPNRSIYKSQERDIHADSTIAELATAKKRALVCHVENFAMSPEIEKGYFSDSGKLYPKVWSCSVALAVIHTHELGRQTEPW